MSEWQPMETAPKDGTPILGWPFYSRIDIVVFSRKKWRSQSSDYVAWTLTHWMPLPEPPR